MEKQRVKNSKNFFLKSSGISGKSTKAEAIEAEKGEGRYETDKDVI